jgi:hypothetical protein
LRRLQELLALMKKKAEAQDRESLQAAEGAAAARSSRLSSSLPDDAQELIAAMGQEEAVPAAAAATGQAPQTHQSQKSRARRLTSTTEALDNAQQPQLQPQLQPAAGLRDSSGEELGGCGCGMGGLCVMVNDACAFADVLNIDDAPPSDKKGGEKKGFFSRAKGWFSGSKSGAGADKEDVAAEANGKKKRSAKAAAAAEVEETRVTRARAKAGDS